MYQLLMYVEMMEYEIESEVEQVSPGFFQNPVTIRFIILFAILIAGGAIFLLHPTADNKKAASSFLESMISKIYTIAVANIDFVVDEETGKVSIIDFEQFKKDVLAMIYEDSWSFVEKSVDDAISAGTLPFVAKRLIKKESVEKIVDLVFNRKDVQKKLKAAFEAASNELINNMLKNEAEAKAEAEAAESQPEEPGDEVVDEPVEAFVPESEVDDLSDIEEPTTEEPSAIVIDEDGMDEEDAAKAEDSTYKEV